MWAWVSAGLDLGGLDSGSEQTYEALSLLNLFLHLVAGGGDFSLGREDCADEGEHRSPDGCVKGPPQ